MVVRRPKKVRKQRGSRVHGYGRISGGHRKSGKRGGVGNAGMKKHHWILTIKKKIPQSRRGFIRHGPSRDAKIINVAQIAHLVSKSGAKEVDTTADYTKVTGKGLITVPVKVKGYAFTENAQAKIAAAGGEVIVVEQ